MGSSSGGNNYRHINASRINNGKNLWTNYLDYNFSVSVISNKIQTFNYAHHYLILRGNDSWFRIAEWAKEDGYSGPCYMFACKKIRYYKCRYLGNYQLRDVINAINYANRKGDNDYNTVNYNCNHWVENVASYLGEEITVDRNCSCIEGTRYVSTK